MQRNCKGKVKCHSICFKSVKTTEHGKNEKRQRQCRWQWRQVPFCPSFTCNLSILNMCCMFCWILICFVFPFHFPRILLFREVLLASSLTSIPIFYYIGKFSAATQLCAFLQFTKLHRKCVCRCRSIVTNTNYHSFTMRWIIFVSTRIHLFHIYCDSLIPNGFASVLAIYC